MIIYSVCQNLPTLFLRQLTSHKFISIETFLFFHKQSHLYTYNLRHNVQTFEMHLRCHKYVVPPHSICVVCTDLTIQKYWFYISVWKQSLCDSYRFSISIPWKILFIRAVCRLSILKKEKKMFLILKRSEYQFKNM